MAATAIAQQAIAGPYQAESVSAKLTTVTFTAADATNGNKIVMTTGKTLLLLNNTGASAVTVTIASSKDPYGRVSDITTFSIAAGAFVARIFEPVGWEQNLGARDLSVVGSATDLKILAIPL